MKLAELKQILKTTVALSFELENGKRVPEHFHITEAGCVTKHFIDCGGTIREEKLANFQLWDSNDIDHRLAPQKLLKIIALSENIWELNDMEIEVEYQTETTGKYRISYSGKNIILTSKQTNCLASDSCGVTGEKQKINLRDLQPKVACCLPTTGVQNDEITTLKTCC